MNELLRQRGYSPEYALSTAARQSKEYRPEHVIIRARPLDFTTETLVSHCDCFIFPNIEDTMTMCGVTTPGAVFAWADELVASGPDVYDMKIHWWMRAKDHYSLVHARSPVIKTSDGRIVEAEVKLETKETRVF